MTGPHPSGPGALSAWSVEGIGDVVAGTDLVDLVVLVGDPGLQDGDVVVVTSKVVSKAEGRQRPGPREDAVADETVRVVARRGPTVIAENHLGLVMAAAGVDASNVEPGTVVLLPRDPDATARRLRAGILEATGANVAVLVSDTAGRPWRVGQTDIAIGVAGLEPLDDHAGLRDSYGNELAVTAPAVADELTGLADLVTGKLGGRPVAVVRGQAQRVLPVGNDGPGARRVVRARSDDLFALGTREAVVAAVTGSDHDCFGSPASPQEVVAALTGAGLSAEIVGGSVTVVLPEGDRVAQAVHAERSRLLAHAHAWHPQSDTVARSITLSPNRSR